MISPDLLVSGPHPITDGIESFECLEPITNNVVIRVEGTSQDDNHNISISWPSETTLEKTIAAINHVWSGQKASLFGIPNNSSDLVGYEIECPLTNGDILQYHPSGFKWLRVETPLNDQMPDLYVPFGRKPDYAGIILAEPATLKWEHFWPLYQATAANPFNEASIRQALIQTKSLAEIK